MNKRTKIVAGLSACVCALSTMCFGFSQWSSDIKLNGTVSAKGSWDLKVTDAKVNVSNGATVSLEQTYNSFDVEGDIYINSIATRNAMNNKIAELKSAGATIVGYDSNKSMRKAYISYYDGEGVFHDGEVIGYFSTNDEAQVVIDARATCLLYTSLVSL